MIRDMNIEAGSFILRLKRLLIIPVFLILFNFVHAEDLASEDLNPADGEGVVPIDGGASLLLAAAAGFGAYRIGQSKRQERLRNHHANTNGDGYPKK